MVAFQFRFMALVVDVIDRRGPSNEMRRQLQPKKRDYGKAILTVIAKDVLTVLRC